MVTAGFLEYRIFQPQSQKQEIIRRRTNQVNRVSDVSLSGLTIFQTTVTDQPKAATKEVVMKIEDESRTAYWLKDPILNKKCSNYVSDVIFVSYNFYLKTYRPHCLCLRILYDVMWIEKVLWICIIIFHSIYGHIFLAR